MPLISVITINRNNATGLERTMASVVAQLYDDFEYLVIDGDSTDGSKDVISKYAPRLAFWVSEPDSGIYNAMNKGIARAKGNYLLFLNSGDYLAGTSVLKSASGQLGGHDIVYGDMIIDRNGKKENTASPDKLEFEEMIRGTLWHPVSFIRRDLFDRHGMYKEHYRIISDYEFFIRAIYLHNATTLHIPLAVSVFDTNGIGSSANFKSLHDKEKLEAQRSVFHDDVILSALRHSDLKRSKHTVIYNWLKNKPFLLRLSRIFYRMARKFI